MRKTFKTTAIVIGLTALFQWAQPLCWSESTEKAFEPVEFKPRLADRFIVQSILIEIFGPEAKAAVRKYVFMPASTFGGPCDYNAQVRIEDKPDGFANMDTLCPGGKIAATLPMIGTPNILRSGYMIKVCEQLSTDPKTMKFALNRIFSGDPASPTPETLGKAFQLFFPTENPPSAVIEGLLDLSKKQKDQQWSLVFKALCTDPTWQLI